MQVTISEASRNLSHWINQASYGRECIVLTSRGRPKAVLIGIDAFESLLGLEAMPAPMPLQQMRTEFRAALAESGYETREKILELVQEVKQEGADERLGASGESTS